MTRIKFKLKKSARYIVWRGFYHRAKIVLWLVSINTTLSTRIRRKRENRVTEKETERNIQGQRLRNIQSRRLFFPWPDLDHQNSHISTTWIVGTGTGNFFFLFFRSGYEILLLIEIFVWNFTFNWLFLLDRFRFDSFLFWVLGFSIKMFVGICFCFEKKRNRFPVPFKNSFFFFWLFD